MYGLGEGIHFGEWWGLGIQRNYGMNEKVFSLFNTKRWISVPSANAGEAITDVETGKDRYVVPHCCNVVPVLYEGPFDMQVIQNWVNALYNTGSAAVPMWKPAVSPTDFVAKLIHPPIGSVFTQTLSVSPLV